MTGHRKVKLHYTFPSKRTNILRYISEEQVCIECTKYGYVPTYVCVCSVTVSSYNYSNYPIQLRDLKLIVWIREPVFLEGCAHKADSFPPTQHFYVYIMWCPLLLLYWLPRSWSCGLRIDCHLSLLAEELCVARWSNLVVWDSFLFGKGIVGPAWGLAMPGRILWL